MALVKASEAFVASIGGGELLTAAAGEVFDGDLAVRLVALGLPVVDIEKPAAKAKP